MSAAVTRSGTVALVGPPNAGKSTLLNALLGEKIAIVAPKPQTTRRVLRGVLHLAGAQAVLIDTPGLLEGSNALEWGMRQQAMDTLRSADLVLALVSQDTRGFWEGPQVPRLPKSKTVVVATKADVGGPSVADALGHGIALRLGFERHLAVSALKKRQLGALLKLIADALPEGEAQYAEDDLTDTSLRDAAAELVREQALLVCRDEVPHAVAVGIEQYSEREDGIHEIHAVIYIERESQKGIIIGKGGERLKLIGTRARLGMEKLAGAKVFLKLWVKVSKEWKNDPRFLKELGYPSGKRPHAPKPR